MSTYRRNLGDGLKTLWYNFRHNREFNRGAAWGLIIISALLAFEIFNFSTTQFALRDVLGDLQSGGMSWATILAIAFCGIDFAGIARIFTPEQGRDEPAEVYYLFGAWLLAAAFNATLTWWGVSVAIVNHSSATTGVIISNATMIKVVPVFVAVMVWLIRVLLIGTFSLAGDRLFTTAPSNAYSPRPTAQQTQIQRPRPSVNQPINQSVFRPASSLQRPASSYNSTNTYRPAPKPTITATQTSFTPAEPTYHPVSYGARASETSDRNYDS
jgi:hypothetical protein